MERMMGGDLASMAAPVHGGADALGVPRFDFSTNSNACGPCPEVERALSQVDASHYPDPAYTELRAGLAALHGVGAQRIVVAGSASEFIHRITAVAARDGLRSAVLPAHSYGDYARAAQVWGLALLRHGGAGAAAMPESLHWACEPSSPLGGVDPALRHWRESADAAAGLRVLDCAYSPLRLDGMAPRLPGTAWQLWTPNKALGLTGVRAAYAIAPDGESAQRLHAVQSLAPSWPVGSHGVALLQTWLRPSVQQWLQASLRVLAAWKSGQQALCEGLGWTVLAGSLANYFVARVPADDLSAALHGLRAQGIKLRDCASFGLPGHVRLGVLPPAAQQALVRAWRSRGA